MDEDGAPRYWLTRKLYCGECGETTQCLGHGVKTGRTLLLLLLLRQRKAVHEKKVKKDWIEGS